MEIRPDFLMLVLACAAVTALPRVLPLVALARVELPAIAAAFAVAFLTRSLLGSAFAGVAVYWVCG
jgi:branched-subunit amino acid transport protein